MKCRSSSRQGFSLVEVVLALGITVFALITIMALFPVGLGANRVSIQQTEAINLATAIVADLRQTPTATAIAASGSPAALTTLSPLYGIDVTKSSITFYLDPSGASSTTLASASRYKVNISLTQPTAGNRNATYGTIVVSWPAAASAAANSVSSFIAVDRN